MQTVINIFDAPFFIIMGGISTLVSISISIYAIYVVIRGVIPVWWKLGKGLSKRKIAIFAESQQYNELKRLLIDSNIFLENNILQVNKNEIKKARNQTLLLVHFKSFKDCLDQILINKNDAAALIIYAPASEGDIDANTIDKINSERNSIIVNMRGRLLNDILTSMITTGYEKK